MRLVAACRVKALRVVSQIMEVYYFAKDREFSWGTKDRWMGVEGVYNIHGAIRGDSVAICPCV